MLIKKTTVLAFGLSCLLFIANAFASDPSFSNHVDYQVGSNPSSLCTADFDGDGMSDLAVANTNSFSVSILINTGAGSFEPTVNYAVGSYPLSICADDFDGNGSPDLAVANRDNGVISILKNNGNGIFLPAVNHSVESYPIFVCAADFDDDGSPDLAVISSTSNNVSILKNYGNATFAPSQGYPAGMTPRSLCAGDFNGDGRLDLAVTNQASNKVSILMNNGSCTFSPLVEYVAGIEPLAICTADFTGDGEFDLAVANYYSKSVSILANIGNGTFATSINYSLLSAPYSICNGDFDLDGRHDLAVANASTSEITTLRNNGDGTFDVTGAFGVGTYPFAGLAEDLDDDGRPDLVSANTQANSISILMNTTSVVPPPTAVIDAINNQGTAGSSIGFVGHGISSGGSISAYNWRSNRDGQLSTQASFSSSSLSGGKHTVYFKVKDDRGIWSTESSAPIFVAYTFVHLTDLHMGAYNENVDAVLAAVQDISPKPSFVIITGDIIDGYCSGQGCVSQWQQFEAVLQKYSTLRYYVCAGNHDALFFDQNNPALEPYRHYFDNGLYQPLSGSDVNVVTLNSGSNACLPYLCDENPPYGRGLVSQDIEYLQIAISAYPESPRIVAVHHPLFRSKAGAFDEIGSFLYERESFMDLCRTGNVSIVLAGHIHSDYGFWINSQHNPTSLPNWSYWISSDPSIGTLPMYVVTDACGEHLAYRKFEVRETGIKAYPSTLVNNFDISEIKVTTPMYPWEKTGQSSDNVYSSSQSLQLPTTVHVYNSAGDHVGFNNTGGIDREIAGVYYSPELVIVDSLAGTLGLISQTLSIDQNVGADYTLHLETLASCTLLIMGQQIAPQGGGTLDIFYPHFQVDSGAIATTSMTNGEIGLLLEIDDNGDGTIDRSIPPDSVSLNFVCGDASADGLVNISDAVYLINYIFSGGEVPFPLLSGDADCSGAVTISDAVYLINYIFAGGIAPCAACP